MAKIIKSTNNEYVRLSYVRLGYVWLRPWRGGRFLWRPIMKGRHIDIKVFSVGCPCNNIRV